MPLELVHQVCKTQRSKKRGKDRLLWSWVRTQATKHIWSIIMKQAYLRPHITLKGLRYGPGLAQIRATLAWAQKSLGCHNPQNHI